MAPQGGGWQPPPHPSHHEALADFTTPPTRRQARRQTLVPRGGASAHLRHVTSTLSKGVQHDRLALSPPRETFLSSQSLSLGCPKRQVRQPEAQPGRGANTTVIAATTKIAGCCLQYTPASRRLSAGPLTACLRQPRRARASPRYVRGLQNAFVTHHMTMCSSHSLIPHVINFPQ